MIVDLKSKLEDNQADGTELKAKINDLEEELAELASGTQ